MVFNVTFLIKHSPSVYFQHYVDVFDIVGARIEKNI